jgi:hypothetical protein
MKQAGTSDFGTWGRYTELPLEAMTSDQKKAYEFTMKSRGQVPGPYKEVGGRMAKNAGLETRPVREQGGPSSRQATLLGGRDRLPQR